jgi:hypothetical protein
MRPVNDGGRIAVNTVARRAIATDFADRRS